MTGDELVRALIRRLTTPRPLTPRLEGLRTELTARCPEDGQLASLVVALYDPRLDPEWLPALWASTQLVVMTTAASLGTPSTMRRELVGRLRRLLAGLPSAKERGQRPLHLVTPVAGFHWTMWRRATRGKAGLYVAVAGLIHTQVRTLERTMLVQTDPFGHRLDRNVYDYLRSARVLCSYGPRLHDLPRPLRRELLNAAGFPA